MEPFSAALRDALLVPNATESTDAVHRVVINQLRELDPQAHIKTTGYFNHSWLPDLAVRWSDDHQRHLFLRFNVRDEGFIEDLRYADDERDPVFLDIAQPEIAREEAVSYEPDERGIDLRDLDAMVTEHQAWGKLGAAVTSDASLRTATRQVLRGGRGLVDEPVAERVVEDYRRAAESLASDRIRETDPVALREVLDALEAPLSRIARLDLETDLRSLWVEGGREPESFPSLEGWELHDRDPREVTTLILQLLTSVVGVSDERWEQVARAITVDALGAEARGRRAVRGGKLNQLVRVARDIWTARWAYVPLVAEPPQENRGRLDWSLGGTSLEVNLGAYRAVFVDRGNRFNMLAKPEELPRLEPRLASLDNSAVTGVVLRSSEETVGVRLLATARETLGERLRGLMAQQADIRLTGRIESMVLRVPATDNHVTINFETGKANAERPLALGTFALMLARFAADMPSPLYDELQERLAPVRPE